MGEPKFSLDDFKRWVKNQDFNEKLDRPTNEIGTLVESKVNYKKLVQKMYTEDGSIREMAKEFMKSGGVIKDIDGQNFIVEVNTGMFYVPQNYVQPQ